VATNDVPGGPAQPIDSVAFRNAELESERLRIVAVLGVVVIFVLVTLIRVFVTRTVSAPTTPWLWQLALGAGIILYESWMLRRVNTALESGQSLFTGFWVLSTILETSIPAFAIVFLTAQNIDPAYRPLASPSLLIFFLFIILFTLRLTPSICLLSGAIASFSYLAAAYHLGWRPPVPGIAPLVTQTNVVTNAIILLTGGIVAASVARQIRKHVEAALREAETKQKLEAVEHDLQVARSIQQSLLPKEPPQIAGFDIAGWNQPADDTGGDYFDWKTQGDGKLVVSLADVTGHGIGPALVAAICHAYARSSFGMEHGLMQAFEHINQALSADLQTGRFVTFVAAVCLPDSPDLHLLSAGHGPLFIYSRSEDRFIDVQPQAVPFGILPFFRSDPPARLSLGSGDLVLLPTDGFFEWENDQGEQFGVERMEKVLRASRELAPPDIIAQLYDAVIRFSNGTKQQDDLTAVIIKRL
jgi:serine phosphatase RsbU (regulator of sigma subunit)